MIRRVDCHTCRAPLVAILLALALAGCAHDRWAASCVADGGEVGHGWGSEEGKRACVRDGEIISEHRK